MELTDALSFMYRDAVKLGKYISIKALVYRYENIFYPKFEKEVCNSYQAVVVCGYLDYQKLSKLGKNLHHFGNGVELPKLDDRTIASKDSVIFVGNLRTLQNQEGIKNFYKHCFKNKWRYNHRPQLENRPIKASTVFWNIWRLRGVFQRC